MAQLKHRKTPKARVSPHLRPESESTHVPADTKEPKVSRNYSLWNIWVVSSLFKILLFDTYHSTDFDVHRNWLAITSRLPLRSWYLEHTSQWTLDYPPFFAYFEWLLAQLVPRCVRDDGCLDIVPVGQYGWPTVVFQRSTVILSEILLFAVLQIFINFSQPSEKTTNFIIASSIVLSPGLLIVDHIHFQYNGMLFGVLIAVLVSARHRRNYLLALLFAALLCLKHIFLYIAPAIFVYLLRAEVVPEMSLASVKWANLARLGAIVLAVFGLAFGPFVYYHEIPQLLARLFPFSRGLTHAYWAPNIWAMYSFIDKVLIVVLKNAYVSKIVSHFTLLPSREVIIDKLASIGNTGTRGLVQDVRFVVLPNISPNITFLLTLFYDILALVPLFIQPTFRRFVGAITLNAFASFLFGWHVHEKAIMLVILPFTFLVGEKRLLNSFLILVSSGYVSLFPLLPSQNLIKQLYTFIWFIIYSLSFNEVSKLQPNEKRIFFFDRISLVYIIGLIPMVWSVFLIDLLKNKIDLLQKYEFVGLIIYSIYCSVGVISSWASLSWLYFFEDSIWE